MVKVIQVSPEFEGQRLDNFLIRELKGVPKGRIYRAIRQGEVRINKGRIKADYRLKEGDAVRLPPLRTAQTMVLKKPGPALANLLEDRIAYEDTDLLIMNKPAGMPVHGGTEVSAGVIELLRLLRPSNKGLELAHRLDKGTSGCLVVAKKRSILRALHENLRSQQGFQKQYLALMKGKMKEKTITVNAPLVTHRLRSGERRVEVNETGKPSVTTFRSIISFENA